MWKRIVVLLALIAVARMPAANAKAFYVNCHLKGTRSGTNVMRAKMLMGYEGQNVDVLNNIILPTGTNPFYNILKHAKPAQIFILFPVLGVHDFLAIIIREIVLYRIQFHTVRLLPSMVPTLFNIQILHKIVSNHHQKTRFRSLTDCLCCIVVKEFKILFNLVD